MSATAPAPTYVECVRDALAHLLETDERVVLIGEDIGAGGAFRATAGLRDRFGAERVRDAPISEAAFTGMAIGLAIDGWRPIVEYQFADFLSSGFTQLVNVAAKWYWRTGVRVPLVVRAPAGGGVAGGPFHSQSPEAWFLHATGIKVAVPGTAEDASLLLRAAAADGNPVLVLEQKRLYTRARGVPDLAAPAVLAGARTARAGRDLTVATYGASVPAALEAAARCAGDGVEAEVLDLRVLCPLDEEAIRASVARTGRLLVVHEASGGFGVGAEIASRVAERDLALLDAPVRRLCGAPHPVPVSPALEAATLPGVDAIAAAMRELAAF